MGNPCVEFIKAQKNTKVMNIYKQIIEKLEFE